MSNSKLIGDEASAFESAAETSRLAHGVGHNAKTIDINKHGSRNPNMVGRFQVGREAQAGCPSISEPQPPIDDPFHQRTKGISGRTGREPARLTGESGT